MTNGGSSPNWPIIRIGSCSPPRPRVARRDLWVGFDRTNGHYGFAVSNGEWNSRGRTRLPRYGRDADIICKMAGREAELIFFGSDCGGSSTDDDNIAKLLSDEPNAEKVEKRLSAMTRMLVKRHQIPILYIAGRLWDVGTLDGEEIDKWWAAVRTQHLKQKRK
jgi:hypothetical protein